MTAALDTIADGRDRWFDLFRCSVFTAHEGVGLVGESIRYLILVVLVVAVTAAVWLASGRQRDSQSGTLPAPSAQKNERACAKVAVREGTLTRSLGLETLGGAFTPVLKAGVKLPTSFVDVFSTAEDNQATLELHLLSGDEPRAKDNETAARLEIDGIRPAPRCMPRLQVSLAIDADGRVFASVVDLDTKENLQFRTGTTLGKIRIDEANRLVEDLSVETLGGVATPIIPKGQPLPAARSEIFSTASDQQPSIKIHVLAGVSALSMEDRILGNLEVQWIRPAPRGVPQIRVSFSIGVGGDVSITAVDVADSRGLPIVVNPLREAGLDD